MRLHLLHPVVRAFACLLRQELDTVTDAELLAVDLPDGPDATPVGGPELDVDGVVRPHSPRSPRVTAAVRFLTPMDWIPVCPTCLGIQALVRHQYHVFGIGGSTDVGSCQTPVLCLPKTQYWCLTAL